MFLIFDTETTGLPKNFNAPVSDSENWPRMVQIAWQLHAKDGSLLEAKEYIITPEGYSIPFNATKIHGITTQKAQDEGIPLVEVLDDFNRVLENTEAVVGHNIGFDLNIVGAELYRKSVESEMDTKKVINTASEITANYCQIPGGRGGKFKFPKLEELHDKLFGYVFEQAHNALADVEANARCFLELIRLGVFSPTLVGFSPQDWDDFLAKNPTTIAPIGVVDTTATAIQQTEEQSDIQQIEEQDTDSSNDIPFSHLHNHTGFSVLTATTDAKLLVQKAVENQMKAVGITDMGNMMGAFVFTSEIANQNKAIAEHNEQIESGEIEGSPKTPIKGVVGCEFYVSATYLQKKFTADNPDRRYTQVLLAKNKAGYHNLAKLSSHGFIDGFYSGYPRVGKDLIEKYSENVIALSGNLQSEIPFTILNIGEEKAEEIVVWYKEVFGEDFYLELIDHGLEEEKHVNQVLQGFAKKYNIKCIAQNDTFYLEQKDANAHDILLCVRDGEKQEVPIGRGRGYRFGFANSEYYFKSGRQMNAIFSDTLEAIENIQEIIDKVENFVLKQEVLLPKFDIPSEFLDPQDETDGGKRGEMNFLRHLTYEGAKKRYGEITPDIQERLDFELETIEKTGYPGYFLIVQDFTSQARKMGVSVGPGRGSAAGSAVAYCTWITNVDPIKYDLLFERFLNPERVSLPDIDIDFDDRGRDKIIQWVMDKYGSSQVAQIITYGTMAAKSAIRDTARVLDLPLRDTDVLAKQMPDWSLKKLFKADDSALKEKFTQGEDLENAKKIKSIAKEENLEAKIIQQATILEGSLRNTGVHACGVIITPSDIREHIPVCLAKDSEMYLTQFDNSVVEDAGLLKMDFLGLKTLTIINDAVDLIEKNHGEKLIPDDFPLDDEETFELFQRGETVGIFQYESAGMQKHLKDLKPDQFEDLIAMNALYRPGPLAYIPSFINRKHGAEEVVYDIDDMSEYLEETYGITVYQEQVMLLSQKLANFSKGQADVLRKAMGKKQKHVLDKMKPEFLQNGDANGYDKKVLEKIWTDWEAFASYAFNKSHSTCYAYIAFQTAYLKAHYPAEFMAAVLSNNMNNIKSVTFFLEECRRMGLNVLGPDVNESDYYFSVNGKGDIRFGMGAIKGVGKNAVENIIECREEEPYKGIFDFTSKVNLNAVNKKNMEKLALGGAFDEFKELHRATFFYEEKGQLFLEKIMKYGADQQNRANSNQMDLFGGMENSQEQFTPVIPKVDEWNPIQKLFKEKEVVGMYISSHPLDQFKYEIKHLSSMSLNQFKAVADQPTDSYMNRELKLTGIVTEVKHLVSSRDNKPFGIFTVEDFDGSYEFRAYNENYMKIKHLLEVNQFVLLGAKITSRYNRVYIDVTNILFLQNAFKQYVKQLQLKIASSEINEDIVEKLFDIIESNPGEQSLNLELFNDKKKSVKLKSSTFKVQVGKDLLDGIQQIPEISFSLN